MKRIFLILVLLAAVLLGASWFVHRARIRALNSGDVFVREQPGGTPPPQPPTPSPATRPTECSSQARESTSCIVRVTSPGASIPTPAGPACSWPPTRRDRQS